METLEEKLVNKLIRKNWKITFAESCTGGLCAARLVSVANASRVFDAGIITYANEAKIKYLSVKEETIRNFGVVSEPVVKEMAEGIAMEQLAQVGVGVSGVAGPGGGTPEKPVGTVCFGFLINGSVTAVTKHFSLKTRNEVREASVQFVYKYLNEQID